MTKHLPFKRKSIACFIGAFGLTSLTALAQTDSLATATPASDTSSVGTLSDLSLEELMNMSVTVASKKEEKISDAPGMVTAYSSKDIEKYGLYTIADLANITPGYSSYTAYGEQTLETRGQKADSWNSNKQLVLIDGIPVNHARTNSTPVDYQLPLLFADQVEYMRGPGSALYGTSAFYGVISAKSRTLTENGTVGNIKMSYGTYYNEKRLMATVTHKSNYGLTNISAGYYGRDFSASYLGAADSLRNNKTSGQRRNYDDNISNSFMANHTITDGKLKGFGVGVMYFSKSSHGGEFWNTTNSPNNDIRWEEFIPYLKYKRDLSEKFSLNSYLKYNHSVERSNYEAPWLGAGAVSGYDYKYHDVEALVEGNYKINENHNIIIGLNYDTRKEANGSESYSWNGATPATPTANPYNYATGATGVGDWFNTYSAYAQYQGRVNFLKGLLITAGLRGDMGVTPLNKYQQLSPRAGLVQKITDWWNVKVLYGQALRSPTVKDLGLNSAARTEVIANGGDASGIQDVKAEIFRSLEAGTNFTFNKLNIAVAVFQNWTLNPLGAKVYTYTDGSGATRTTNISTTTSGGIQAYGGELEAKYAINRNLYFVANHSIAKATINDSIQFTQVPTQKTNLIGSFTLPGKVKLTSTVIFRQVWGMYVNKAQYGKDVLDGYNTVDVNFLLPLTNTIGIEMQLRNIFDTKWYQPSLSGPTMDMMMPGRRALFTLNVKF